MTSRQLLSEGFSGPSSFSKTSESQLLDRLCEEVGVYVIVQQSPFGTLRGETDIIYIGSATNKKGLKNRIRHYFHPGRTQKTNIRILAFIGDSEDYSLIWRECGRAGEALALERDSLDRFELEHSQLPPQNLRH